MLKAGFAAIDITPANPVPLAGYFTLRGRLSKRVRDPLYVRAAAFEEGDCRVLLIVFDLLMTTEEMVRGLERRLADTHAHVIVSATHSHSAPGGFWDSFVPKLALGPYIPGMLDALCNQGEQAARAALDDLDEARWSVSSAHLPELAKNRRDPAGAVDDGLWVLRVNRNKAKKGNALITGFPGHPVIVAERDPLSLSADFPGEVVKRLEAEKGIDFAMFVNGALGGVDVLFPEADIGAEENLALQSQPIAAAALAAKKQALKTRAGLKSARREVIISGAPAVKSAFDNQKIASILLKPLDKIISHAFGRAKLERWRLDAFALGDVLFLGAPADLGVSLSLAIQAYARDKGFAAPFVASQTGGYIGYVHRRADYLKLPAKGARGMAIYENIMGIFGHDIGEQLLDEARKLIDGLAAK